MLSVPVGLLSNCSYFSVRFNKGTLLYFRSFFVLQKRTSASVSWRIKHEHGRWFVCSNNNCVVFIQNNLTFYLDSEYLCPRRQVAPSQSPCRRGSWKTIGQTGEEEEQVAYRLRWWRCHPEACSQWGTAGSYLRQIGECSIGSVSVLNTFTGTVKNYMSDRKSGDGAENKRIYCSHNENKISGVFLYWGMKHVQWRVQEKQLRQ